MKCCRRDELETPGEADLQAINTIRFEAYHFQYPQAARYVRRTGFDDHSWRSLRDRWEDRQRKTTLLRQFGHRYPYSDQVPLINEQPLTAYQTTAVRNHFAEVPQEHTFVFTNDSRELVIRATRRFRRSIVEALEAACFSEDIKRMPEGLETVVGEKGVSFWWTKTTLVLSTGVFTKQ